MLIACAGDAHCSRGRMEALLSALPEVEAFCFLGDCDRDADWLGNRLGRERPGMPFYAVAGNNDPYSQAPNTLELSLGGMRILITHGHLFRVKLTLALLAEAAAGRGCGMALFGHTHLPYDGVVKGVRLCNPGALMRGAWALAEVSRTPRVRLLVL